MKLAFSTTACPGWELRRIVDTAQRLGFSGLELAGFDDVGDATAGLLNSAEALRQLLAPAGLCVCSVATSIALHHSDERHWKQACEGLHHALGLARELGAPVVRVFGYTVGRGEGRSAAITRLGERLRELSVYAADATATPDNHHGVRIALQNGGSFVTARELWTILEAAGHHPNIGVCWDAGEAALQDPATGRDIGDTPSLAVPTLNSRIHLAHLWDHLGTRSPLPLGQGHVRIRSFLDRLRGIGYNGCLVYAPPAENLPEELALQRLEAAAATLQSLLPPAPSDTLAPKPQAATAHK